MFQTHNGDDVKTGKNFNNIDESILSCLCYFDVFDYPLKIHELHSFLPEISIPLETLEQKVQSYPLNKLIIYAGGYYFLFDRDPEIISIRRQAEQFASHRWIPAKRMTKIIKMFPYVRAVFISGDLSKNVSSKESDIDYFILTEPGCLWITRSLLILFKKTVLLNDKKYYCLNFFRSTDYLNFDCSQDYFTATELVTLKSLYNTPMFGKLLDKNKWVYSYFPNYKRNGLENKYSSDTSSIVQAIFEKILDIFPLDRVDTRIMKYMQQTWHKRYNHLSDEEIAYRFRCTKDESTAFVEESRRNIMTRYTARVKHVRQLLKNESEFVKI